MANCNVELMCRYGIGKFWRYNILVDGNKYSKNFPSDTKEDDVRKNAEQACQSGLLDTIWDSDWAEDCIGK